MTEHLPYALPSPADLGLGERFTKWRPAQIRAIDSIREGKKRVCGLVAPTGFGKCFGRGTQILLHSGRVKAAEDIQVGDVLMGPDSQPRYVTSTTTGRDVMYGIVPTKGEPYVVNSQHILCLRSGQGSRHSTGLPNGTLDNITVTDFLNKNTTYRHCFKGYRAATITFPQQASLPLPPYFLGLWLGDGSANTPAITTTDLEIVAYVHEFAATEHLDVRTVTRDGDLSGCLHITSGLRRNNAVLDHLRALGVWKNKHIPFSYLTASEEDRLELLAGLLDSDGSHIKTCFDFISKLESLADGVAFLSRSLGMAAYINPSRKRCQTGSEGEYWRVTISGSTSRIPTKIERKQAPIRRQRKDVLSVGLTVRKLGEDDYFGFTVVGPDHRFLLGDFTVAHNSLTGAGIAKLTPGIERAVYLTATRGLQDQFARDHRATGLIDIRGQQNYPCIALEPGNYLAKYRNRRKTTASCEEGPCHGGVSCYHAPDPKAPWIRPYCDYYGKVWDAQRGDLVNANYAYWFAAGSFGAGLGDFDLAVCDEAHNAVDELERFLVFDISNEDCGRLQNEKLPHHTDCEEWAHWGMERARRLTDRLEYLKDHPPHTSEELTERRRLQRLQARLDQLRQIDPAGWVCEREERKARFSPLDIRPYVERHLFRGSPKVVLMSATLTHKTMELLGLSSADYDLFDFPSTFPVARRPVIGFDLTISVRLNAQSSADDLSLWLERIDRWIDARRHLKGIIHAISYDRTKYLITHSRHRELMIHHEDGHDMLHAVNAFRLHEGGAILVSPSIMTGHDFPGEECRWQIVGKIPIPDPRGPIMQARTAADPDYPFYIAVQKLVQAVGRSTRSEEDWSEVLIADDNFGTRWFRRALRQFAPTYFLQSIKFLDNWTELSTPLSFPEAA